MSNAVDSEDAVHNHEVVHLLLELEDERTRARRRESVFISLILHLLVIITILAEPKFFKQLKGALVATEEPRLKRQITYLAAPPDEQRLKIKPKTPVLSDKDRLARPGLESPGTAKLPPLPPPPKVAPKAPEGEGQQLAKLLPPPHVPGKESPAPGEAPEAPKLSEVPRQENPKLTLPAPGTPGKSIEESLRGMARNRAAGGGETVWDEAQGRVDPRSPAAIGQAAILSDTQGVNFNPYLQRILVDIRRNWYAVMPEIARLGKRGRVIIQFEILKDGVVPKLYLVGSSGSEPLDRAALASISASVPFSPLPGEFRGGFIRLQITYLYNLPLDYQ